MNKNTTATRIPQSTASASIHARKRALAPLGRVRFTSAR